MSHRTDDAIVVLMYWVYMLRCADNTLYVGLTTDLERREVWHNEGTGSSYTAKRRPVHVVYTEAFQSFKAAQTRERQLKRWTRSKKEALIVGDKSALKRLSRSHDAREE